MLAHCFDNYLQNKQKIGVPCHTQREKCILLTEIIRLDFYEKGLELSGESVQLIYPEGFPSSLLSVLFTVSQSKKKGGGGLEIKQSPHTVRCVRRGDASRAHHWTTKPHRKTQCQTRAALARELLRVVLQREEGRSSFSRNPPDRPSCFSEGVVERKRGLRRWRDLGMHAHGYG